MKNPSSPGSPRGFDPGGDQPGRGAGSKKWTGLLIRVALSFGILGVLLFSLDLREMGNLFVGLRWDLFALVVGLIVFERALNAWKLMVLLQADGSDIGFRALFRIQMTSACVGILLPTAVGMDVLRVIAISRCTSSPVQAIAASVVDRGISVFLTLLMAAMAALVAGGLYFQWSVVMVFPLFFIGAVLAVIAMALTGLSRRFRMLLEKVFGNSLVEKLQVFHQSLAGFRGYKHAIAFNMLLFLLIAFFRVTIVYCTAAALNIHAGFLLLALVLPFTWVALMLPISIGGIGLQDGAYYIFLQGIGISGAAAVSISILEHILIRVATLPGLFLYLRGGLTGGKFNEPVVPVRKPGSGEESPEVERRLEAVNRVR